MIERSYFADQIVDLPGRADARRSRLPLREMAVYASIRFLYAQNASGFCR